VNSTAKNDVSEVLNESSKEARALAKEFNFNDKAEPKIIPA